MEWGARLHSEAMPCSRPKSGLHEMPLMRAAAGFGIQMGTPRPPLSGSTALAGMRSPNITPRSAASC